MRKTCSEMGKTCSPMGKTCHPMGFFPSNEKKNPGCSSTRPIESRFFAVHYNRDFTVNYDTQKLFCGLKEYDFEF